MHLRSDRRGLERKMSIREIDILETKTDILADNDKEAAKVRALLREKKVFLVNLMASPGAGKTSVLVRTINALKEEFRIGVMEADVDSDVDARAVQEAGARVIQLHTGGSCHMDADMTRRGMEHLGLDDLDLLFLENVGNLVCPAEFDVGANRKVMILSVPEGDDKPLKYPLMFQVSDCMLINKIDVKPVFSFDEAACREHVRALNAGMPVFPLSAKTGDGFDAWIGYLRSAVNTWRNSL